MRFFYLICVLLNSTLVLSTGVSVDFKHLNHEDGLSQNTIQNINQDQVGYMWFATTDGLNRYDGYEFKIYRHNSLDLNSISGNNITSILKDSKGTMWVGTADSGVSKYDERFENFTRFQSNNLSNSYINTIFEDSNKTIWLGSESGLFHYDPKMNQFALYEKGALISHKNITTIFEDTAGLLWFGTLKNGLFSYNSKTNSVNNYTHQPDDLSSLSNNSITTIHEDRKGVIWIGTNGGGINLYNKESRHFVHYMNESSNQHSLISNQINIIYEDSKNNIWVGTKEGLDRFNPKTQNFDHFTHKDSDYQSLSYDDVLSIYEDSNSTLWFGTLAGGLNVYNSQNSQFNHYKKDKSNIDSLSHNTISSFYEDSDNLIWIGTVGGGLNKHNLTSGKFEHFYQSSESNLGLNDNRILSIMEDSNNFIWIGTWGGGINIFNKETKKFSYILNKEGDPNSLNHNSVLSLLEDKKGSIWIGTWGGGLDRIDKNSSQFLHFRNNKMDENSLSYDVIWSLYEDSKGNIWIGTYGGGLNKYVVETNSFERFEHVPSNPNSLSHNAVFSIYEDKNKTLWVGTSGGLNKFNPETNSFTHYREKDGLTNDSIYGILEDKLGNLWLSSNKGLTKFNPQTETFKNYDVDDGLQSNEFTANAYYKSQSGEMFFGGINGFNRFYPENIKDNTRKPPVALTGFLLLNQPVPIQGALGTHDKSKFTLPEAINELEHLILTHKENSLTFEFSALDFTSPKNNKYAYKLVNWNNNWISTNAKNRRATYTNIPAGDYIFQVKASNGGGYWNNEGKSIKVTILPAPWKTWWAYTIYLLSFLALIYVFFWLEQQKRLKEQAINARLIEVDKLKEQFLTNTSHELRTPLNGIIGLSELLQSEPIKISRDSAQRSLHAINQCGKQLELIVDELLDFSQLQNKKLALQPVAFNINALVDQTILILSPQAKECGVIIEMVSEKQYDIFADPNRIRQVLYNLINNAIKFSQHDLIQVIISAEGEQVKINVKDKGEGIPIEMQEKIFLSFTQIDGSNTRGVGGMGLGLAICKEIIELHGSKLELKSNLGQGSEFSFKLPTSEASSNSLEHDINSVLEESASLNKF